ncbi:MAG TPA: hypothetical protein VD962_01815, partial [Rubricoccaceae bacterium]|nr:hypothetical protein [Rubricoccaceae bacterium]
MAEHSTLPTLAELERMDPLEALDHLTDTPLALGAAGLRASYQAFLFRGLLLAVALHLAGFATLRLAAS